MISAAIARPEVRYLVVGGLNTAFSYGLYTVFLLLLHANGVAGDYAIATTLSWLLSNFTSFVLQRRFVFRAKGRIWLEFVRFSSVTFGSFLANIVLGTFAVAVLGLTSDVEKLLSQLVITIVLVIATYVLHRVFSFRSAPHPEAAGTSAVIAGQIEPDGAEGRESSDLPNTGERK